MYRPVLLAGMLLLAGSVPLPAQQLGGTLTAPGPGDPPPGQAAPAGAALPAPGGPCTGVVPDCAARGEVLPEAACGQAVPWETVWGLMGLRVDAAGPRIAPNGYEYHPFFSFDLNFNAWLWRSQRLYLFGDFRFWGEKPEYGVTNGKDGSYGFSKREFDLTMGPAWNYYGNWEGRLFAYSFNNLNRGQDPIDPFGFLDGFGIENRYYLSPEYARLGQTGFDVARATFVGLGYYLSKNLIDNDGHPFTPGALLRAYLICDLWDWPAYAFCDAQFITKQDIHPKMLYYDLGLAARPFAQHRQWEFRLGVENAADFEVHSVLNLWYGSIRYIF